MSEFVIEASNSDGCRGVVDREGNLCGFGSGGTVFQDPDGWDVAMAEKRFLETAAFPEDWSFRVEELG